MMNLTLEVNPKDVYDVGYCHNCKHLEIVPDFPIDGETYRFCKVAEPCLDLEYCTIKFCSEKEVII